MVVVVGFMVAGKTTVGHIMAERLGQPFVDSDVLIEQRLGPAALSARLRETLPFTIA
jgi:shikimate kinase